MLFAAAPLGSTNMSFQMMYLQKAKENLGLSSIKDFNLHVKDAHVCTYQRLVQVSSQTQQSQRQAR